MLKIENMKICSGCHACFNACPKGAIEMKGNSEGFKYPIINKEKCINCGLCEKICPFLKETQYGQRQTSYACYNKNDAERAESSSGGTFILLAKEIINMGGVVFGAGFDENFNVVHSYAEKIEDVQKFMKSKYVQSTIGDSFKKAKEFLQADRYVLFSGTPCQIEGLKSYLMKDYDKLILQDIICHGVPSPKAWNKYKEFRKKLDNSKLLDVNFRQKDTGWDSYSVLMQYEDNKYYTSHREDPFMQAFLRDAILRESCFECKFKKIDRMSDITLADYWGIKEVHPEMYDNKGISLVKIHSNKGAELFDKIKDKLVWIETDIEEAAKYNPSMVRPVKRKDENRKNFFENLELLNFDELVEKYTL